MFAPQKDYRVRSAFFWPKERGHWDGIRPGTIVEKAGETYLNTKLNVLTWRHAAIRISRIYLKCGESKRDYRFDDPVMDEQAAHGSWMAGTAYARGLKEAPEMIESKRIRYRAISKKWRGLLGFEGAVTRKRRYSTLGDASAGNPLAKRHREYISIDGSDD
jgi:hypothetical protein